MNRWLPHPILALLLALVWLFLNDSVEPTHLLLGALAGVAGSFAYGLLQPPTPARRRVLAPAAALVGEVLLDILRSNLAVARIVLRFNRRPRVAGFLPIPLQLQDPAALALLACIVTATPGTSWARHDARANVLVLHVLDLVDEEEWVRQFKFRYERHLLEIFG